MTSLKFFSSREKFLQAVELCVIGLSRSQIVNSGARPCLATFFILRSNVLPAVTTLSVVFLVVSECDDSNPKVMLLSLHHVAYTVCHLLTPSDVQ